MSSEGPSAPDGSRQVDARSLRAALERDLEGEVLFDAGHRAIYAHDSSNYRQVPIGVVVPRDSGEVEAAIAACREHGAPVTPRGCGTSLAGQACNDAVVIDTSKHMRRVVEIDPDRALARVEPGVVRDQLTDRTEREHRLTFAPDTSTHEYATFGGMIGNNACGVHSVMAGRTSDNLHELEVLTYDGVRMRVGPTREDELERIIAAGGRRGEIYRGMRSLRDRYAGPIRERFPDLPRRVSGYNLDELLPERGFNVARLLAGSEGTLATVLEATVRLVHSPPARSLIVLGYPDIFHAADHVPEVLELDPLGLEAVDEILIRNMELLGMHAAGRELLPPGRGWLLVEVGGETGEEASARARECVDRLRRVPDGPEITIHDDPELIERLWEVRESGLGATAFVPGEPDRWEGWEDAAVPPERLGDYLRGFRDLLARHGYETSMYGHFGDGCVHCRIDFDLETDEGVRRWRRFLDEAAELVVDHGGSLSGEHGDGQSRAELLDRMFGRELVGAFGELKRLWDPAELMNPHKVVDPYPITSNLVLGDGHRRSGDPDTHFSYPEDSGSFARAALRCVGAGKCRETEGGTMCPSYMVTLDEQHSTRGRARILHEMLRGEAITDGFRSDDVHEALDLCLSCKGCKSECPVSVDMAIYKAEFLSRHYSGRLRPRQAYSMGLIMFHGRLAAAVPGLVNAVAGAPWLGGLIKRAGGISPERAMPPFPRQTFRRWFRRRRPANPDGPPVLLFADTFSNHLHPEPIKAAVEVLEHAGYRVTVPEHHLCCGRPLYDYGMLDAARFLWRRMLDALRPEIRAGTPLVGIEPSCVAAFRDELPNLLADDEDARRLSEQSLTLAELLAERTDGWRPPPLRREAIVHGHCHQEAIMGIGADRDLLEAMGLDVEVLDSGCCGVAGSFGFERDHHEISVAIGERRLLPAVRDAPEDAILVADGFSCKTQISELTDRRALHLAQVIRMAIDHGPDGPPGTHPESGYPDVEPAQPGMREALAGAGLLAVGGTAVAAAARRRS